MNEIFIDSTEELSYKKRILITRSLFSIVFLFLLVYDGLAQTFYVAVIVKKYEGEPSPSMNIAEKVTQNSTFNKVNGSFPIAVFSNTTLIFSYIRYVSDEILVKSQSSITTALVPDISQVFDKIWRAKKETVTGPCQIKKEARLSGAPQKTFLQTWLVECPG